MEESNNKRIKVSDSMSPIQESAGHIPEIDHYPGRLSWTGEKIDCEDCVTLFSDTRFSDHLDKGLISSKCIEYMTIEQLLSLLAVINYNKAIYNSNVLFCDSYIDEDDRLYLKLLSHGKVSGRFFTIQIIDRYCNLHGIPSILNDISKTFHSSNHKLYIDFYKSFVEFCCNTLSIDEAQFSELCSKWSNDMVLLD